MIGSAASSFDDRRAAGPSRRRTSCRSQSDAPRKSMASASCERVARARALVEHGGREAGDAVLAGGIGRRTRLDDQASRPRPAPRASRRSRRAGRWTASASGLAAASATAPDRRRRLRSVGRLPGRDGARRRARRPARRRRDGDRADRGDRRRARRRAGLRHGVLTSRRDDGEFEPPIRRQPASDGGLNVVGRERLVPAQVLGEVVRDCPWP